MKIKYRAQDYEARLNDGIILYRGSPHRVVTDGRVINLLDPTTGRTVVRGIDPADNDLDISSPTLGYINAPSYAYYLERIPSRRYKQSLDARAIRETRLTIQGLNSDNGDGYSEFLYSEYFVDSYKVGYPSFTEARKMLDNGDRKSVAVSRDVAMVKDELDIIKLYYKLELVGWVAPNSTIVMVPSSEKAWVISMHFNELGWEVE